MRGALALILALALPGPVLALSCQEPDIHRSWWQHADAPETYVLALGAFTDLRDPDYDMDADTVTWQATFAGHTASARGFDQPFATSVTIRDRLFSQIAGAGGDPLRLGRGLPGLTGLVFLRQTADGHALDTALCVPVIDTDPAHVGPALECLNGRRCPRP